MGKDTGCDECRLILGWNGSTAEIFTLATRQFPQVVVIGEPTNGGLSDILDFDLPNGWSLGL